MADLFELMGKLKIDGVEKAEKDLQRVSDAGEQSSEKLGKSSGKLGKITAAAAKLGVAAVGAAASGIALITKQSIQGYAQYEQLTGGINKIFGKNAQTVIQNAQNAYKTAGMSANDYMNTVTQFSASLVKSLGGDTVKAAKSADMAISDMSDNANMFGTNIGDIQNAYQGFAKNNFTMLKVCLAA